MTPQRSSRIKEVWEAALEKPEQERPAFLDSACGGDAELRAEVEHLLAESHAARKLGPGDTLAHYRIESKLGEGGMGRPRRSTIRTSLRFPISARRTEPTSSPWSISKARRSAR
jgi:hypothetical protein